MARKKHLINVHTSTGTTAPTGASLYLGEIAVQHTPNDPALWIKVGTAETSTEYEKFIGLTEITNIFNDSKILGSGYTYSGLSYVNSSTTIADAYSALTKEMIDDEKAIAAAFNDLNDRLNELSASTPDIDIVDKIIEDEEITAAALNVLNGRVGTLETQFTGDYIPLEGYALSSAITENDLLVNSADTVNDAFGKLQKQILDDEEAIAASVNDLNDRVNANAAAIAENTGVTALSGAVVSLSATTGELSAATAQKLTYIERNYTISSTTQALSAAVMSVSALTNGVLTVNLNGVEQGKYSPSANTTLNLEAIQEVTGADVLLTGYQLASGTTEEELAIVATDTVNEAFGKIQKQNYDNEAVIAGSLNDLNERITVLEANSGVSADLEVLSGQVITLSAGTLHEIDVLSAKVLTLSAIIEDNEYVVARTLNDLNDKVAGIEDVSGLVLSLSATLEDDEEVISTALNDLNGRIVTLSANSVDSSLFDSLSARVNTDEIVLAGAVNDLNRRILSANTNIDEISGYVQTQLWIDAQSRKASNIPASGMMPNVLYELGTVIGDVTFSFYQPTQYYDDYNDFMGFVKHYYWTFETAGVVPTSVTWPSGITWLGGSAPTLSPNKHYEISVLNNVAVYLEV